MVGGRNSKVDSKLGQHERTAHRDSPAGGTGTGFSRKLPRPEGLSRSSREIPNVDVSEATHQVKNRLTDDDYRITIELNTSTWRGMLTVTAQSHNESSKVLLHTEIVAGSHTPVGNFHASYWEKDHVSRQYGSLADTPYSKTLLGGNAFGPYQLHIAELEHRGIYIHGTMGPTWNPSTTLNALVSPTSHGCIRMANTDNIKLRGLIQNPAGIPISIKKR